MSERAELIDTVDAILDEVPMSNDGTGHVVDCGWDWETLGGCQCVTLRERIATHVKAREAAARREALLEAAGEQGDSDSPWKVAADALCEYAEQQEERAKKAEAKVARVEALAEEWANDHGVFSPDSRYTHRVMLHEIRAALAEPERDEEGSR